MVEERPLSCPLDDPLRPEPVLSDLPDELLLEDRLPADRLPLAAGFLEVIFFDLCPLLRRAVAVCFMILFFNLCYLAIAGASAAITRASAAAGELSPRIAGLTSA